MDNFIVSARKYRPATFDMVVGQSAITSTLKNAIRNNMLAQAFLFTGPRGVGKTTCARILAKTINCLNPTPEMEACDQCESCVSFRQSASFNIHELDAASNNSVDDIRNLVDQVRIPPQVGKYKIYIIDEVHMLSAAAFNAFLKTLEEPPSYAKFILATTEKHKIIPTILSRCQIYDFKRITVEDIKKYLLYVAGQEGVNAEPEALDIIAQKADGALRDALSLFDQMVSFSGDSITYKNVIKNLNVLDYEYYFRVTDHLLHGMSSEILLLLNEIIDKGFDGQHFLNGLGSHFRNLLLSSDIATVQLLDLSPQLISQYEAQASACPPDFLLNALQLITQCDLNYARSSNKRLLLEVTLLQICSQSSSDDLPVKATEASLAPLTKPGQQAKTSPTYSATTHPTPTSKAGQPTTPISRTATKPDIEQIAEEPEADYQKAVPKKTVRPAPSPSGKSSARTISISASEKPEAHKEDEPVEETEFTQESLQKVWTQFAEQYENTSPSFASVVSKCEPQLKENYEIHFDVPNHIVFNDKINVNALIDFLRKHLANSHISLHPHIVDTVIQNTPYLDSEKFQLMVERQPSLRLLVDELGLEPDL